MNAIELERIIAQQSQAARDTMTQKASFFNKFTEKIQPTFGLMRKYKLSQLKVDFPLTNPVTQYPFINTNLGSGTIFIKADNNGKFEFAALMNYITTSDLAKAEELRKSKEKVVIPTKYLDYCKIDLETYNRQPADYQNAIVATLTELSQNISRLEKNAFDTIAEFYQRQLQIAQAKLVSWENLNSKITL